MCISIFSFLISAEELNVKNTNTNVQRLEHTQQQNVQQWHKERGGKVEIYVVCGKGFIYIWCCLVSVLFAFEKKIRCAFVWCNVLNDRFTLAVSVIQIFHIFINFFPLFLYYSSTEKDCIFGYNCGFACFFFCFCHIFSSCKSKLHYVHTHIEL